MENSCSITRIVNQLTEQVHCNHIGREMSDSCLLKIGIAIVSALLCSGAIAQSILPKPPNIAAKGYILMDFETESILAEFNSDEPLPPASLTKIMTSYVAAAELESERISLDDMAAVSETAWRMAGSSMFIEVDTRVKVSDLLRGVIIQSGNDASVALAEYVAGSESAFAGLMNEYGERIGLTKTQFVNSTGLPDVDHLSTARDTALLSLALIRDYPEHYKIYSERDFTFNDIRQPNRNRLLSLDKTVDGIKTGYTQAAGYCLAASAVRDGMRLISVVMGTEGDTERVRETRKLFSYGFRNFETRTLYKAGVEISTIPVRYGEAESVGLALTESVIRTIPRGADNNLKASMDIPEFVEAPVESGQSIGQVTVTLGENQIYVGELVTMGAVAESGFFSRFIESIKYMFTADGETDS